MASTVDDKGAYPRAADSEAGGAEIRGLSAALLRILAAASAGPAAPAPSDPQEGTVDHSHGSGGDRDHDDTPGCKWVALREALDLEGGARVHRILGRASAETLSVGSASGSASGRASGSTGARCSVERARHLAECAWDVSWEKLHIGDWKDTAQAWRDAFSAAALIRVALTAVELELTSSAERLDVATGAAGEDVPPSQEPPQPQQQHQQQQQQQPGNKLWLEDGLRQLDMAVLLGGPLFREEIDKAIHLLQTAHTEIVDAETGIEAVTMGPGMGPERGSCRRKRTRGDAASGSVGADAAAEEEEGPQDLQSGMRARAAEKVFRRWGTAAADTSRLPPGSLTGGVRVRALPCPSLEDFLEVAFLPQRPLVVTGVVEHWPASTRWVDPGYLLRVAGCRTVPIEVGSHYLAEEWRQDMMTFSAFFDKHILGKDSEQRNGDSSKATPEAPPPLRTTKEAATTPATDTGTGAAAAGAGGAEDSADEEAARQSPGYLAQHALFDQIPALRRDILTPDYCALGDGEIQAVNAWIGPSDTVSPAHTDPHNNLLCQVVGWKYVRLFAPSETTRLYPHTEGLCTNSSRVDFHRPDASAYPLFADAAAQEALLGPGDALFIPRGWWHFVMACSPSASVSFWWS